MCFFFLSCCSVLRAPRETVRDIQESFKFQAGMGANMVVAMFTTFIISYWASKYIVGDNTSHVREREKEGGKEGCLLYTSPSPRDRQKSRMPSSA